MEWDGPDFGLWDETTQFSIWLTKDETNSFSVWTTDNKSGIWVGPNCQFFLLFLLFFLLCFLFIPNRLGSCMGMAHVHLISSAGASFPIKPASHLLLSGPALLLIP